MKLYKVGNPDAIADGAESIDVALSNLTDPVNKYKIVASRGTDTAVYDLTIAKRNSDAEIVKVIGQKGLPDETVANKVSSTDPDKNTKYVLYVRDDLKDLALYIKSSNEKAKISLEGVSDSQVGEFNADISLPLDQKEIKKVITVVATDNTKKNYDLVISRENRVARLDEVAVNDTVIEYKNGAYTAYLDESAYPTMENATAKEIGRAHV